MAEEEPKSLGDNFGLPDSAQLANRKLGMTGRVGRLVIKLTKEFDSLVDTALGAEKHNKYGWGNKSNHHTSS